MVLTKKTRYDYRDNIISESRMGEHGESVNTKKQIGYDKNGNISSVKETTEFIFPGKAPSSSSSTTEFEYKFFEDQWRVSKVIKDGMTVQECLYFRAYDTAGDREFESKSTIYDTDSTHSLETYELTDDTVEDLKDTRYINPEFIIPKEFRVYSHDHFESKERNTDEYKITYGNSDFCAYSKVVTWEEDGIGVVDETFWVEERPTLDTRRFIEKYSKYKIDKYHNIIEMLIDNDEIGKVSFTKSPNGSIVSIKEVINDQTSLPYYFYNIVEERKYGFVNVFLIKDPNQNVIVRRETLDATQEVINDVYYTIDTEGKDPVRTEHIKKLTEYDQVGLDYKATRIRTEEQDGSFHDEKYLYDNLGRMIMKTVSDNTNGSEYEGHIIYEYDINGNCILDISENSITNYIFDEKGRKVFTINNTNYPLAKDVFDFYFNKVIQSI